ncbi:hypothetical protein TNCV_1443021 [Trichonephila clavipes]|nr:hypothetical protein TNCV_1443021 [Trichonephila clavipes]
MAPQIEKSVSAVSDAETTPPPTKKRNQITTESDSEPIGFMDTIVELKFFAEYPSLLDMGKQLRNAQPHEKIDVFYRHIANQR